MALLTKSKKLHFELFLTANKLIFFEIGALFLQNTRLFSFKNSLKMLFLDFVNSAIGALVNNIRIEASKVFSNKRIMSCLNRT
ncbi:MAG TPA: hypothetical protein QKA08_05640, partial [Candidatus Megaira endosymbiont of Nemacystus decipiens]|nr:hypothetical protein [Candidatus Megaera endosymbiont of Nemacystus decipiens]